VSLFGLRETGLVATLLFFVHLLTFFVYANKQMIRGLKCGRSIA
jgi:hypothetical protein